MKLPVIGRHHRMTKVPRAIILLSQPLQREPDRAARLSFSRSLDEAVNAYTHRFRGIQEEAPGLGVPVLVMRETTERPEGIETGVVRLVGTQRNRIVAEAERLLRDPIAHAAMATGANPYGDGRAASRIVSILLERSGPLHENCEKSCAALLNEVP